MVSDAESLPRCPRCGYDLRGVVETWREACPLEGVCSECGLTILWSEVLQPEKFEPRWCVEYEPEPKRIGRACVRTALRSFVPWRFWSRLRMEHAVKPRRLAIYVLFLMLPLLLVYVAAQTTAALFAYSRMEREAQQSWSFLMTRLPNAQSYAQSVATAQPMPGVSAEQHIAWQAATQAQLARLQKDPNAPISDTITISRVGAVIEAVFLPFAGQSRGDVYHVSHVGPYVAPRSIHRFAIGRGAMAWSRYSIVHGPGGVVLRLHAMSFGGALLIPLTFLLLPATLRRAQVRHIHLLRIGVYSLAVPVGALVLTACMLGSGLVLNTWNPPPVRFADDVALFGTWAALAFWWYCALRIYLRLPQPSLIVAVQLLMTMLAILVITYAIDQDFIIDFFRRFAPPLFL